MEEVLKMTNWFNKKDMLRDWENWIFVTVKTDLEYDTLALPRSFIAT